MTINYGYHEAVNWSTQVHNRARHILALLSTCSLESTYSFWFIDGGRLYDITSNNCYLTFSSAFSHHFPYHKSPFLGEVEQVCSTRATLIAQPQNAEMLLNPTCKLVTVGSSPTKLGLTMLCVRLGKSLTSYFDPPKWNLSAALCLARSIKVRVSKNMHTTLVKKPYELDCSQYY